MNLVRHNYENPSGVAEMTAHPETSRHKSNRFGLESDLTCPELGGGYKMLCNSTTGSKTATEQVGPE